MTYDPKSVSSYSLSSSLVSSLESMGITHLRPIQERSWPIILQGQDIAIKSDTGSGKTLAFLVPLVDRVIKGKENEGGLAQGQVNHFVLILVPTRELGLQIESILKVLLQNTDLQWAHLIGGEPIESQIEQLRKKPDFVIATPGRLIDLYKSHHIDLKQVRALVLDEADRFIEVGFKSDLLYLIKRMSRDRQWIIASATLSYDILYMSYEAGADCVEVKIGEEKSPKPNVEERLIHLSREEKPSTLLTILNHSQYQQAIVFTNFKNQVEILASFLRLHNFKSLPISSQLPQKLRNQVIQEFRKNQSIILVATDLAARGLDIQGVDLVINYELPNNPETYIHRLGRAGRSGRSGECYSLSDDRDVEALERIQKFLDRKLPNFFFEDYQIIKEKVHIVEVKPLPFRTFYQIDRLRKISLPKNQSKRTDKNSAYNRKSTKSSWSSPQEWELSKDRMNKRIRPLKSPEAKKSTIRHKHHLLSLIIDKIKILLGIKS